MPETVKKVKSLNERLAVIQKELKAPKSQYNDFGKYSYRNCEDILEAVKPLLGDMTLIITDTVVNIGDRYYVEAKSVLSDGTNQISAVAYAREANEQKGMNEAQITGSTSSYARKYSLNGLFAIDDTKDADSQDNTQKPAASTMHKVVVTTTQNPMATQLPPTPVMISCSVDGCKNNVTEKIRDYSMKTYGKVFCMAHQLSEGKKK